MDMAIGVIIGAAFSDIVTSLTDNFINPILKAITAGARYDINDIGGFASNFLSSVVNFIIMAFILFCLLKAINKALTIGKKEEEKKPTTKECPFCKSQIPIGAVKCGCCTSDLPAEEKKKK